VPQEGLKKCLDYGEPARLCRGNPGTWLQKFYQNGGDILVRAGTNVRRREHGPTSFAFLAARNP
jgi:hypothetical protein